MKATYFRFVLNIICQWFFGSLYAGEDAVRNADHLFDGEDEEDESWPAALSSGLLSMMFVFALVLILLTVLNFPGISTLLLHLFNLNTSRWPLIFWPWFIKLAVFFLLPFVISVFASSGTRLFGRHL